MGCHSGGSNTAGLPELNPSGEGNARQIWTGNVGFQEYDTVGDAIGRKGRAMSLESAVLGANPYYSPETSEFSENCQRAVIAVEMRRRGYDVTAQPTYPGDKLPETAFINRRTGRVYERFTGAFKGAKSENVRGLADIESKMKGYGDGSRAALAFGWKKGNAGHVINVEYKNGKLHFVDGQVGGKYNPAELMSKVKDGTVTLTRLDNLRISSRMKKSVEKTGRRK